jgi:hypothetical protein
MKTMMAASLPSCYILRVTLGEAENDTVCFVSSSQHENLGYVSLRISIG